MKPRPCKQCLRLKAETHDATNRSDKSPRLHCCCDKSLALVLSLRYVARIQTSLNSCDRSHRQWFSHVTRGDLLQQPVAATCRGDVSQRFVASCVSVFNLRHCLHGRGFICNRVGFDAVTPFVYTAPVFARVTCFPAFGTGYMFSRAWRRQHASMTSVSNWLMPCCWRFRRSWLATCSYFGVTSDMKMQKRNNAQLFFSYFLLLGRFLALFALFLDLGLALRRAGTRLSWLCSFFFRSTQHSTNPPVSQNIQQAVNKQTSK